MSAGNSGVCVGQFYMDVNPPRREWRVSEEKDGLFTLVRTDNPGAFRYLEADALLYRTRYRLKH